MSIRNNWMWTSVFIASVLSLSGCSLLPKEEAALQPPLVKPVQEQLQFFDVKKGKIVRQVQGVAIFEPSNVEYYQFEKGGGKIKSVDVRQGDDVRKGQTLIELNNAGLQLTLMQNQLEVEKRKYALQQAQLSNRSEEVKIAKLELDIATKILGDTLQTINNKKLVAQSDGEVIFVEDIKPGDFVQDSQVLVNVADSKRMRLYYEPAASDTIAGVEVGMKAKVTYSGKSYEGTVVQTPSSAPAVKKQFLAEKYARRLYIDMKQVPPNASFGSSADILITTAEKDDALVIPRRALRTYLGGAYVQIMEGDKRREVDVSLGIETPTEVEIVKGLSEGQKIILP